MSHVENILRHSCGSGAFSFSTRTLPHGFRCLARYVIIRLFSCDFFNFKQQDATTFDYLFKKGSTCFGRFLRPSSGAHNCTLSLRYCQPILLQASIADEIELT